MRWRLLPHHNIRRVLAAPPNYRREMDKIKSQEEVTALESQRADSRSAIQQSARGNGVNNKSDDDQMQPLRGNIHWRRENDDNDLQARYGTIYSYSHLVRVARQNVRGHHEMF